MQTAIFIGSSQDDIRAFPESVRREMGKQILRLQHGLDPADWKPMKTVGAGVREIRVKQDGQYRTIYVTNIGNAVYILHAFKKKTQKTSAKDLAIAQRRFKQIGN